MFREMIADARSDSDTRWAARFALLSIALSLVSLACSIAVVIS